MTENRFLSGHWHYKTTSNATSNFFQDHWVLNALLYYLLQYSTGGRTLVTFRKRCQGLQSWKVCVNVSVTLKIFLYVLCMCWVGMGRDKAVCHDMYVEVRGQYWVFVPLSTLFEMKSFMFITGPTAFENSFVLASCLPEQWQDYRHVRHACGSTWVLGSELRL